MSKTLVVHYTPRGERSKTKELVDAFVASAEGKTELVMHDLAEAPAEMFLRENLMAYIMRNMVGEEDPKYDEALKGIDKVVDELVGVDHVVLAFPLYNYSVPAVVKAWIDSVVVSGETFTMEAGRYKGLMTGNALVLSTSGGAGYGEGGMADYGRPLAVKCFEFMGYQTSNVQADGANQFPPEEYAKVMDAKKLEISELVNQWY
ncbi:MAG: FMN-dependent NADH-azoreductase [Oceanicoccus sp.]|jgi:FMN-dependent NADH-azoreductase